MAVVPITLSFTFQTQNINAANFDLFYFNEGSFGVLSGNDITTPGGITAFESLLSTFITGALPSLPGGTVTSITITYNSGVDTLDINIIGEGDNSAINISASIGIDYINLPSNIAVFRFGSATCPECPPNVNPDDATDCLDCYQQEADNCATEVVIQGLTASTEYVATITDNQSGKVYNSTITSDGDGELTITTANYPAGLFSPYNSPLTITLTEGGDDVVLTYGYVNYSCIELTTTNNTEI